MISSRAELSAFLCVKQEKLIADPTMKSPLVTVDEIRNKLAEVKRINSEWKQVILEGSQRQIEAYSDKQKRLDEDIRKMDEADDASDDLARCNANVAAMLWDRRGNAASIEARLRECAEPMSLSCKCEELMLEAAERIAKLEALHVAVTNHIAMYDGTIEEFNMTAAGIGDALAALE